MITDISRAIEGILNTNELVFTFGCVRSEEELKEMVNVDVIKSVGYTVVPVEVYNTGKVRSELTLFVIDKSNDNIQVLNNVVDSSLLVLKDVVTRLEYCSGVAPIETEYIRSDENDSITVVLKCTITCFS